MEQKKFSAILLAGGISSRTKIEMDIPKQCLEVANNKSMIQYQIEWLNYWGVSDIILAINTQVYDYLLEYTPLVLKKTHISIETEKLGSGGAVKYASRLTKNNVVYICNADDFILSDIYSPDEMVDTLNDYYGSVLTSRGRFPYGVVKTRGQRVVKFDHKPLLDTKVYTGHCAFTIEFIEKYFPERGDYEDLVLSKMVKTNTLTFHDLEDGEWVTGNTWKEIKELREKIDIFSKKKKYGIHTSTYP